MKADTEFLAQLKAVILKLRGDKRAKFNRHVSLGDLLTERDETAEFYGFGRGTTCYNSVLIMGDVKVGKHCWIGPNVILDGTGGLVIGDHVDIGAGSQIYTHHTVDRCTSMGKAPIPTKPTKIGSGVYIGPNSVIQMGVNIGDGAVIGAMSFVNRDVPAGQRWCGVPARRMLAR